MERGSILVLGIISVLILSIMAIAGLTVTDMEIRTTGNYHVSKMAFYKAVEGVEKVKMEIAEKVMASLVTSINYTRNDTKEGDGAVFTEYITGTLNLFEDYSSQNIKQFEGFDAPPFKGLSLGHDNVPLSPVIWYVPVTAMYQSGRSRAYAEIQSGIYSTLEVKN